MCIFSVGKLLGELWEYSVYDCPFIPLCVGSLNDVMGTITCEFLSVDVSVKLAAVEILQIQLMKSGSADEIGLC